MSEQNYKSYTGRWSQSKFMTVDSPTMELAVEIMKRVVGKDPLTIVQWKDNIYVADEKSDKIHIKVIVKWAGSDKTQPPYGTVYPSDFYIPPDNIAIVTAVPNNDRVVFVGFQDEDGEYLNGRDEYEYAFKAKTDVTLYAVFSDTLAPKTSYTFDTNTFMISSDNVVSLNTTDVIINDPYKIPTSQAVFKETEKKIETITLNGREVEIENKEAKIDLSQDYLYEDEDINFADIF